MKPMLTPNFTGSAAVIVRRHSRFMPLCASAAALLLAAELRAADIYWTNTANAAWSTASNWEPNTLPTSADNAILGHGDSANPYIDITGTIGVDVGRITLSPNRTLGNVVLRQQSGVAPIRVYGLDGVLVTNASVVKRLQIAQNGVAAPILYLAGSGDIGVPQGVEMLVFTGIRETNGSYGFTKTGAGTLTLQTPTGNTHTGPTTIREGTIDLRLSTARLGPGTIYLAGGTLLCGADRSGVTPQASPVIVTGDAAIKGNIAVAGTRVFPFSGTFGGDTGSLTIDNNGGFSGNNFVVRLTGGGFTFTRPIILQSINGTYGARAVLQLQNSAAAGTQTFTGVISSYDSEMLGMVERSGADGTTIFTGANTYPAGTVISRGTLLANNTTGSALGSGNVTVTNLGILGGSGIIEAVTTPSKGGRIAPGAAANAIGNLRISSLHWGEGSVYDWQIASVTGVAGTAWDLITVTADWADQASSSDPVTIKVDSQGAVPAGWNAGVARDWVILQSSYSPGFVASDFALDTTGFSAPVSGVFGLFVDGGGSLHLTYTPASDIVINVPAGLTNTQAAAGHPTLSGLVGVAKIGEGEVILDNGANDYQGATKVLAGTLSISVDAANGMGALGVSSSALFLGNTLGGSNATFNINTATVLMSRDIVVQAGSSGIKTIGTTVTSGAVGFQGDITFQDSAVLNAPAGSSITFSGDFGGDGGVTLSGAGNFTLAGTGTYGGATMVNTPSLTLKGPAFGTNAITFATALALDNTSGTDVNLNPAPQNWNADIEFIGTGNLSLGSGPVTLGGSRTVQVDAGTLTVGGPISGNGGLTKTGSGALYLAGSSASSYTGGTTNLAGVLAVNGTATFGNGAGPLVLAGGSLLCKEAHTAFANPVILGADSVIVGTNTTSISVAFGGPFSNPGGNKLTIANKGHNTTVFGVRLLDGGDIDWPIVVGDSAYDRPAGGVTNQLEFYSTTNAPTQIVSGLISGKGSLVRGNATPNTGGATIFTAQNTLTNTAYLFGGAIGFGADSVSSGGVITSGPIGTGLFTIGNQTGTESNMTVFAHGGPRTIENPIFLNGARNVVFDGTNDLTLSGAINAGGIPKMWTVRGTGLGILSGQITSSGEGAPLTKAGVGTLVLKGENLYTGATTIQQGTLLANNTTGSATGPNTVAVRPGATLGGTGSVAGLVTVTSGSLAPGQDGAGTLALGGGVNFSNGGTYVWDLAANSTSAGSFDVLAVTGGNVILDGTSQILINFTGAATAPHPSNSFWQIPHSWTILSLSGSASNPGLTKFPTIVNPVHSGGTFTNYADAGGNIVMEFIPGRPSAPPPVISRTVQGAGTPNPTLTWTTESGYLYRLEYKTNLNQINWLVVDEATATGSTMSMTHTNSLWPECYYRVIAP